MLAVPFGENPFSSSSITAFACKNVERKRSCPFPFPFPVYNPGREPIRPDIFRSFRRARLYSAGATKKYKNVGNVRKNVLPESEPKEDRMERVGNKVEPKGERKCLLASIRSDGICRGTDSLKNDHGIPASMGNSVVDRKGGWFLPLFLAVLASKRHKWHSGKTREREFTCEVTPVKLAFRINVISNLVVSFFLGGLENASWSRYTIFLLKYFWYL